MLEARKRQLNYEEALCKLKKVVCFEEVLKLVDEAAEVNAELQSPISNAINFISSAQGRRKVVWRLRQKCTAAPPSIIVCSHC